VLVIDGERHTVAEVLKLLQPEPKLLEGSPIPFDELTDRGHARVDAEALGEVSYTTSGAA